MFAESQDDVKVNDQGATVVSVEGARFRVAPEQVRRILATKRGAEKDMTDAEKTLRAIVLARTISLDDFKKLISEQKPELATFLDMLERTGALHFPIQPVGFVLAQHEMHSRTPGFPGLNEMFDDDA
jgi:hypothetical protein